MSDEKKTNKKKKQHLPISLSSCNFATLDNNSSLHQLFILRSHAQSSLPGGLEKRESVAVRSNRECVYVCVCESECVFVCVDAFAFQITPLCSSV